MKNFFGPKPYSAVWTIPNVITIVGVFLLIPYIWGFLAGGNRWVMFGSLFLASLSDLVDGFFARKLKQKTKIGEFIDTLRDKLLLLAILTHFLWLHGISVVWGWCGLILLVEIGAVVVYFSLTPHQRLRTYCFRKVRVGHVFLFGAVLLSMYFRDIIAFVLHFDFKFYFNAALPLMAVVSFATLIFYIYIACEAKNK